MKRWELYKGDEKIADINMSGVDQPWFIGELSALGSFEQYRPLFVRLNQFIKKGEFSSKDSEVAAEEIAVLGLSLKDVAENKVYSEMMINIDGDDVLWRV